MTDAEIIQIIRAELERHVPKEVIPPSELDTAVELIRRPRRVKGGGWSGGRPLPYFVSRLGLEELTSALNMLWREGSVIGTDAYTWRTIEEILEEQLRERPPALVVAAIREAPTTCRVMSEVAKFVEDRPKAADLVNCLINSYRRRDRSHSSAFGSTTVRIGEPEARRQH